MSDEHGRTDDNPDPWCTSPDPEPADEITDIVTEDYIPNRWEGE
jgi:hypothetical protein